MRFIAAFLLLAVPAHALDLESAIRAFESQGKNLETVLREFSFEGVSLGTTVEQQQARYQVLEKMTEDNDKALGLRQIRGSVIDSGMEAQVNDHRAKNTDVGF